MKGEVSKGHLPAVIAGFSGWLLDSFDFFLVTFCLTAIARDFHKSDAQIALFILAAVMAALGRERRGHALGT